MQLNRKWIHFLPRAVTMVLMVAFSSPLFADAVVRNQSMFASTIAEIFVENDQVRIELEIGSEDIEAFKNLLPDPIYEDLTGIQKPLAERLGVFFNRQLVVTASESERLTGAMTAIAPGKRQQRDPITGEALTADEETVINAVLVYNFSGKPAFLAIQQHLGNTPIGFVAYHGAVAVNDFRYLGPAQVLDLDWEDPWYSSFRSRALRRTYSYAMSGFLYIEPYEVRKEIIVRPKDMQYWVDIGLQDVKTIDVDRQPDIKQKIQQFLDDRLAVKIDGEAVTGELERINFLERSLKSSRVIDPPEPLDVDAAVLGLIYTFPVDSLPQVVTMDWDLFNDRIKMISASSVDQAGPLPVFLEPDYHILEWKNFLKNPDIPKLIDVGEVPPVWQFWLAKWRWLIIIGIAMVALGVFTKLRAAHPVLAASITLSVLLAGGGVYWLGQHSRQSEDETRQVVSRLLQNIYHAFDYRKESKIYDVLSYSVEGDLLTTIYLETRKGLLLANQGGARTKVKDVTVTNVETSDAADAKMNVRATWEVTGSVGHWGHVHTRKNQYNAELLLSPQSGNWKIEDLEILEEQRIN
jgi:hypothetical protein